MTWTLWALMIIAHGAFTRWAETISHYSKALMFSDVLLITIALLTIDQLQGLGFVDFLRIGLFFVAFGVAGRHLMGSVLGGRVSA